MNDASTDHTIFDRRIDFEHYRTWVSKSTSQNLLYYLDSLVSRQKELPGQYDVNFQKENNLRR